MDRVDAHAHVFERLSPRFPREVSDLAPTEKAACAEQLLREMDAAGIDRAVLIQMGGTEIQHHRYIAQCIQRWPDRFAATGLVDLGDPDPPARLRELYEATGIGGIRIMGALGDPAAARPEDLEAYGLFQCAEALRLNINLYCTSTQVQWIERLVRAFPQVNISLDHLGICPTTPFVRDEWGRPRFDEERIPPSTYPEVIDLAAYPNVYVKISGEYAFSRQPYPYEDLRPMVEQLYAAYGPQRMMWASDFPWIVREPGYGKLATLIDHHLHSIPKREKEMIAGETALKIWFRR